jgi:uncharacterized membrane protein YphA (DoxX/SURF4 family)
VSPGEENRANNWKAAEKPPTLRHGVTNQLIGRAARLTLAAVWLHQGLWAKVLDGDPSHREIVGRMPGMNAGRARAATVAIGLLEASMAVWVMSGRRPRACAAMQTALMAGFNAGALSFARDSIASPWKLIARNTGLAALAWLAAW